MFKALDGLSDSECAPLASTRNHILVLRDYGQRDQIVGVAYVDPKYESAARWWVHLPDGTVRSRGGVDYKWVEDADADIMVAFETYPVLRVSYRPISAFLHEHCEIVAVLLAIVCILIIFLGLAALSALTWVDYDITSVRFWEVTSKTLYWLAGILSLAMWAFVHGSKRYQNMTKDDEGPQDWYRKKKQKAAEGVGFDM